MANVMPSSAMESANVAVENVISYGHKVQYQEKD